MQVEWHHVHSINWRDDGVEPGQELVVLEKGRRLLGTLEVLKTRLRCSVRASGSPVVWVLLGFTVQRCRKPGFMDSTAHSTV